MSQQTIPIKLRMDINNTSLIPPQLLKQYEQLYYYQKETVLWLLKHFNDADNFCSQNNNHPLQTSQFRSFDAFRGLLIGHSPGLGKTPITCLTLSVLLLTKQVRYALVIVPKTLIEQWKQHLSRWCSNAHVAVYSGSNRNVVLQQMLNNKQGILLTTYRTADLDYQILNNQFLKYSKQFFQKQENNNTFLASKQKVSDDDLSSSSSDFNIVPQQNKFDNQNFSFRNCAFDIMILDEATEIKNAASQVHQSLAQISSFFKIALTGTPIMNNIKELYNIVNFLNPGFLGSRKDFVEQYDKPIGVSRLKDATRVQMLYGVVLQEQLVRAIRPIFIRYTKEQVSALSSEKTEIILWMNMSETQNNIYEDYINSCLFKQQLQQQIKEKIVPFQLISCLRKVCENILRLNSNDQEFLSDKILQTFQEKVDNYVSLTRVLNADSALILNDEQSETTDMKNLNLIDIETTHTSNSSLQNLRDRLFMQYQNQGKHKNESNLKQAENTLEIHNQQCSIKMHIMLQLIEQFIELGLKTLIFTEHTTTLNLIQLQLQEKNISHLRIDGKVAQAERRQQICTQFNTTDTQILLMTIKVGGMGLNLQGAQRVIIYSPHWNPSIEEQAVARAYRIGQKQDVVVYKLLVRNSIEEKLVARQFHKLQLANQVTSDVDVQIKANKEDIKELFKRRNPVHEKMGRAQKNQLAATIQRKLNALNEECNNQNSQQNTQFMMKMPLSNEFYQQQSKYMEDIQSLQQWSLEETMNNIISMEDANLKEELQIIEKVIKTNAKYNVLPSCIRSTYQMKQNQDIVEEMYFNNQDEEYLRQFRKLEQVCDSESGQIYRMYTIDYLRANTYEEKEQIIKHVKKIDQGPKVDQKIQDLLDDHLMQSEQQKWAQKASQELITIFSNDMQQQNDQLVDLYNISASDGEYSQNQVAPQSQNEYQNIQKPNNYVENKSASDIVSVSSDFDQLQAATKFQQSQQLNNKMVVFQEETDISTNSI